MSEVEALKRRPNSRMTVNYREREYGPLLSPAEWQGILAELDRGDRIETALKVLVALLGNEAQETARFSGVDLVQYALRLSGAVNEAISALGGN